MPGYAHQHRRLRMTAYHDRLTNGDYLPKKRKPKKADEPAKTETTTSSTEEKKP